METLTAVEREEIIQNCMDYTLTSWSKQRGLKPLGY